MNQYKKNVLLLFTICCQLSFTRSASALHHQISRDGPQGTSKVSREDFDPLLRDLRKLLGVFSKKAVIPQFSTRSGKVDPSLDLWLGSVRYRKYVYSGKSAEFCLKYGSWEYKVNPKFVNKKWSEVGKAQAVMAAIMDHKTCIVLIDKDGKRIKNASASMKKQFTSD